MSMDRSVEVSAAASSARRALVRPFALVGIALAHSAGAAAAGDLRGVCIDERGADGAWVRGEDYKAHFGPEGASLIPFLGSSAPRNFPLELRVREVRVGERSLELAAGAPPVLEGATVRYERGGVRELFELSARSIEQVFELDAPDPQGELVLRIAVETELAAREAEGG